MAGSDPGTPLMRGLLLMASGVGILTVMDAVIKVLTSRGMPVTEAMFLRNILAVALLLPVLSREGGLQGLVRAKLSTQIWRGIFAFATGWCFFTALTSMPIADALALAFASPLIIALLSGPMLGERVERQSWWAIGLGFVGVVVVLEPGGEMIAPSAILALLAAVFYALNSILLRRLGHADSATVSSIWGMGIAALGSVFGAASGDWVWPAPADWPLIALAAFLGAFGGLAIAAAFRLAPAATLSPLEYTSLLWALGLGWLLFGDLPGPSLLLGAPLVILGGVLVARRG